MRPALAGERLLEQALGEGGSAGKGPWDTERGERGEEKALKPRGQGWEPFSAVLFRCRV